MDEERLADALVAMYLELIQMSPPTDVDQHLRFASDMQGTLNGSDWGAAAWASDQGRAVQELLLDDATVREWFGPPPQTRLGELRGRLATFFSLLSNLDPNEVDARIRADVTTLVSELVGNPIGSVTWLVRGIEAADDPLYVPPGFVLFAATREAFEALGAGDPTTIMSDVRAGITLRMTATRAQYGAYSTSAALAMPEIFLTRFLEAIWIATGVRPAPFLRLEMEQATYWAYRPVMERFAHERAGADTGGVAPLELLRERLEGVFSRYHAGHDYWWAPSHEDDEDFATARGLRAAAGLASAIRREPDGAIAAMMAFAMADGLLRERDESESVVVPRLLLLLGTNTANRRALRRQFQALEAIRHAIAHGSRPDAEDVDRFLGSLGGVEAAPLGDILEPLRQRALEIGRHLLAAVLFLNWDLDLAERDEWGSPRLVLRMHRREYLEMLRRAHRGDAAALQEIGTWLPDWISLPPGARREG